MILKTKTIENGFDVWNFYDNIETAAVRYDEQIGQTVCCISFRDRANSSIVLALQDSAFLLNDDGKTIERIIPAAAGENRTKLVKPVPDYAER